MERDGIHKVWLKRCEQANDRANMLERKLAQQRWIARELCVCIQCRREREEKQEHDFYMLEENKKEREEYLRKKADSEPVGGPYYAKGYTNR